jgi:hypothetical protein
MKFGLLLQNKVQVKPDFTTVTGTYKDSWFETSQSLRRKLFFESEAFIATKGEVFSTKKAIMW